MQRHMLIINLDSDYYGLDVRLIQEVIKVPDIRELPDAPNFVEGIISLRDHIVPLIKIKRLLDIPRFDLYPRKKIVVLNFGEGVRIGLMVDNIIGVQSYLDEEIRPVVTVSQASVVEFIIGIIKANGRNIGILDLFAMFFSHKGDFLYKHYFGKGDVITHQISINEYHMIKKALDFIDYPFNDLTKAGIIKYINRIATLREKKIEDIIKDKSVLISGHFELKQKRKLLFENKADMYMIGDILKRLVKKRNKIKVWVLGNGNGEDAYSIAILFNSFDFDFKDVQIINSDNDLDALVKGNKGEYSESHINNIPSNLWEEFFEMEEREQEKVYKIRKKIKDNVIFDFFTPNTKYFPYDVDLIYAPNYLSNNNEVISMLLSVFEKTLNREGILALGLFENIEAFVINLKKYYIKNRLVFIKER